MAQGLAVRKKLPFWVAKAPAEMRILSGWAGRWKLVPAGPAPAQKRILYGLERFRRKEKEAEEPAYLNFVTNLGMHELLGELNYWYERVLVRGITPYKAGSSQDKFLKEMIHIQYFIHQRPGALSGARWRNIIAACVGLRSLIVPTRPPSRQRGTGSTKMVKMLRQQTLALDSNWTLTQKLAERVGSYDLVQYEFNFVTDHWKIAWDQGPERFSFGSDGARWGAEVLLVDIKDRPLHLRLDQVEAFKEKVKVPRIRLWETKGEQPNLFGD